MEKYPLSSAEVLCDENMIYCAVPKGVDFPRVSEVPDEWYALNKETGDGQLEFRKYRIDYICPCCGQERKNKSPYTGWMVSPVVYKSLETSVDRRFPQVQMADKDVLKLWTTIVDLKGCVSDGVVNLFG